MGRGNNMTITQNENYIFSLTVYSGPLMCPFGRNRKGQKINRPNLCTLLHLKYNFVDFVAWLLGGWQQWGPFFWTEYHLYYFIGNPVNSSGWAYCHCRYTAPLVAKWLTFSINTNCAWIWGEQKTLIIHFQNCFFYSIWTDFTQITLSDPTMQEQREVMAKEQLMSCKSTHSDGH